jgi:S-(hydroxymethyl)glutathione dehydrogenase/alcohol dehydrogenase
VETAASGPCTLFPPDSLGAEKRICDEISQSISCTRKRGVTIWIGHAAPDVNVSVNCFALVSEKTVMGSLYGTARPRIDFPRLLSLYKSGKLNLDDMVTREYKLEQVNEAFEPLGEGEVARSVLRMS